MARRRINRFDRDRNRNDVAAPFGPEIITRFVTRFPSQTRFVVAFSGGADSLALLHAFAQVRIRDDSFRLDAVHVDHHLHADSAGWARWCLEVCHRLAVKLTVLEVDVTVNGVAHSDEAAARAARYKAFEPIISSAVLCTAHSMDDHVETVLLNLLRGAGPRGLAGIPDERRLGQGIVARPVRGVSRAALHAYAQATGFTPIHDPANEEQRFARVRLRKRVMPILDAEWPGVRATLARTATLNRESAALLDTLAAIDLKPAGGIQAATLEAAVIAALEPARRRNAIAGWLRAQEIAVPGARRLDQIAQAVITAKPDAMPCVRLGEIEVRRFRGRVCLVPHRRPIPTPITRPWPIPDTLVLEHGCLTWVPSRDGSLDDAIRDAEIRVRLRGEEASWMPPPSSRGHTLKKRFQQLRIPPWERGYIPLVYVGEVLAAIGSEWINPRLAAAPGKPGWRVMWTPKSR